MTSVVLILEMTGNYEQLFPLLVACLIAYLVGEQLRDKPIYEALLDYDLRRRGVHKDEASEPVLMDFAVEPGSLMDGRKVRDLGFPKGCLLVTVRRAGRDIVPGGDTRLRPGDQLTLVVAGTEPESVLQLQRSARASG